MGETRKLAAIVFTDIKGYTSLMANNEVEALKVLECNRAIQKKLVKDYQGDFVKEIGDGTLLCFQSAIDAVHCSVAILKASQNEPRLNLRIGIHLGDIVFKHEDVYGDGVNIASRIEQLTSVGCVCMSDQVYQVVRNKTNYSPKLRGEQKLKNVDIPVKVYCIEVVKESTKLQDQSLKQKKDDETKSIVVLPFINMSPDSEQEYFCDGITEELINALTHVEHLKVIARTSAFAFKNQPLDVKEIARRLQVGFLVEGSVRKSGKQLRINVQLVNTSDGHPLWSERYDRELNDIFHIQEEISLAIVEKLMIKIAVPEKEALKKRYTDDTEVYNLLLLGKHHVHKFTEHDTRIGLQYFEKALTLNNKYAPVYTGMGVVYLILGGAGLTVLTPAKAIPRAKELLQKAIAIDASYAEAHAHLCFLYLAYFLDIPQAGKHINDAIKYNPNNAEVQRNYAWYLSFLGEGKKAILAIQRAMEIDPLMPLIYQNAAYHYYFNRQYDKTIVMARKALEIDPHFEVAYWNMGMAYMMKQMPEKALEIWGGINSLPHLIDAFKGYGYAKMGMRKEANDILEDWRIRWEKGVTSACGLALINLGLENFDKALHFLQLAVGENPLFIYTGIVWFDPLWDELKDNSEFAQIFKKRGMEVS